MVSYAEYLTKTGKSQLVPIHEFFGYPYTIADNLTKDSWKSYRRKITYEYEHKLHEAENENVELINGYLCFLYHYRIFIIKREEITDEELVNFNINL